MWVDIANLMGPQGADGADGKRGEPGPVNIGLDPDAPIGWDQAGGFTFNFVDGSEQTVNLPIASAQSAGLQAPANAYDSGWVDVTQRLVDSVSGSLVIRRIGRVVWADFRSLIGSPPASSWYSWTGIVPAGFRPPRNWQYLPLPAWAASSAAGPLRIARDGSIVVYNARDTSNQGKTVDALVSWVTDDAVPLQ